MASTTTAMDFATFVGKVKERLIRVMRTSQRMRKELNPDELIERLRIEDNIVTADHGEELAAALTEVFFRPEMAKKFQLEMVTIREPAGKGASNTVKAFKIFWNDK